MALDPNVLQKLRVAPCQLGQREGNSQQTKEKEGKSQQAKVTLGLLQVGSVAPADQPSTEWKPGACHHAFIILPCYYSCEGVYYSPYQMSNKQKTKS